ncbi:hypothetical protein QFC21_000536 [Naganishia friedmannii]|uniref:Uncharacterized protein n=1 Tax=Naganishia friedmannii TaxID=89922 RepID=A0ACC2WC36_9TREE|nr:hypothetical protein QFC21_000536 [Naganishia friedmannii]
MSGKAKSKESNAFPQGKRNHDLLQRLNHLYQANTYLASVSHDLASALSSVPSVECNSNEAPLNRNQARKARRRGGPEKEDALAVVARRSNQRFKVMVKHNILHTDPSLKRSFCKGCNTICIPGLNARVRVKSSKVHGNKLITTCSTCSTTRTIPAPPTQTRPDPLEVSLSQPEPDAATSNVKIQSDGVDRITKRQNLVGKSPFWRKEAPAPADSVQEHKEAVPVDSGSAAPLSDSIHNDSLTAKSLNSNDPVTKVFPIPLQNNKSDPVERFGLSVTSEVVSVAATPVPTAAMTTRQPARGPKQKQPKAQKQKGKHATDGAIHAAKQDGHHIWRGGELVTGWGDLTQPRRTASST